MLEWRRPIRLRFNGNNEVQVVLSWKAKSGYSIVMEKYFDEWPDSQKELFEAWTLKQDNLRLLDQETTWTPDEDE